MQTPAIAGPVLERALITIRPGRESEFEAAFAEAKQVIASADGFGWLELHRGVEAPDVYLLLVCWQALEDHMQGFRESERFTRWRELIGPYFATPPDVQHYTPVVGRFTG